MQLERVLTKIIRKYNVVSLIFSKLYTISFVVDFDSVPSEDVDNPSPRENLEIFTDAIRVNINDQLIQIYNNLNEKWGYTPTRDDNKVGSLTLCFELRRVDLEIFTLARDFDNLSPRVDLEIFTDAIRVSINEQLIQIYNSLFDFKLKYEVGIHGCERKQQRRVVDRLLQLLIQLCFGLGRENLEIFTDAIRTEMRSGDTRLREKTTKTGRRPTFIVTNSVVFWTWTRELRNFHGCHSFKLKCDVGVISHP
ncbi:hypothetical protein V1477_007012 [Vespula maculifrons]|uniref:Uncharacterized protein n=1 Tax=Vespula maculifrons TaxID=7453 RepID=A0ABD2CHB8_VESMC